MITKHTAPGVRMSRYATRRIGARTQAGAGLLEVMISVLIMVAVFAGFASGQLVMFQQVGFGLAVAVILDATVVRSVLVPASMALLGDRNWYLPRWLAWLPDLRVEGAPAPSPVTTVEMSPAD